MFRLFFVLFSFFVSQAFCGIGGAHGCFENEYQVHVKHSDAEGFKESLIKTQNGVKLERNLEDTNIYDEVVFVCTITDRGPSLLKIDDRSTEVERFYSKFQLRNKHIESPVYSVFLETDDSGKREVRFLAMGETIMSPHLQLQIDDYFKKNLSFIAGEPVKFFVYNTTVFSKFGEKISGKQLGENDQRFEVWDVETISKESQRKQLFRFLIEIIPNENGARYQITERYAARKDYPDRYWKFGL